MGLATRSNFLLSIASVVLFSLIAQAQTFTDPRFIDEVVVGAGSAPVGFQFAPDGRIFIWTKPGTVQIFKNGALLPTPFLDISSRVNTFTDRGLIAFGLDPDFENNGFFYVGYVLETGPNLTDPASKNMLLSRFQADPLNPDTALAGSEKIILGTASTIPCVAGADCMINEGGTHTIDDIRFAADGTMLITVGEGAFFDKAVIGAFRAQDMDSLNGKVLRINTDGTAPADNPFFDGDPNSNHSKVYDLGLRNPFRFGLHPVTQEPWIGNVGWFTQEAVDVGQGKNFGWPCWEGDAPEPDYQSAFPAQCAPLTTDAVTHPVFAYGRTFGTTVIGGFFYTAQNFPAAYQGNFFFGDFSFKWIKTMVIDARGNATVQPFEDNVAGPIFLDQGPDGNLYYIAINTQQLRRVRFVGTAPKPPIAEASATPTSGGSPLNVNFSSAGSSDPQGFPLSFSWDFGDGARATAPNPAHTYASPTLHTFIATLTVTNQAGLTANASVNITVGRNAPTIAITAPADGSLVHVGDTVNYSASATDAVDGKLPPSALSWEIVIHHNTHVHTFSGGAGNTGSIVIANHDPVGTFSYELVFTATNTAGLSSSTSVLLPVDQHFNGCQPSILDPSVTICTPADQATVASPVQVSGAATSTLPVTGITVLVDGTLASSTTQSSFTTSLNLATGKHQVLVQGVNQSGISFSRTHTIFVTVPATPDFSLTPASGSSVSASVAAGQTATYNLSISGANGFSGTVNLTCSGAPAGADCAVTPNSISLAGGAAQGFVVSVATQSHTSAALDRRSHPALWWSLAACLAVVLIRPRRRRRHHLLAAITALTLAGFMVSCGGVQSTPTQTVAAAAGTPAGTYAVQVSATSGNISHQINLTLKVQ
ncbi:MAG TPA: PQQ-dependent sugar dehydrogenase [Candidatus Angelobacter sp.]|nr:PQQ-dependent sugar dehydrogenase [Candidatus Angelobacter sp.]